MSRTISTTPSADELALVAQAFGSRLLAGDVHALLAYLNKLTTHRFTGIYRFEPGWVVSVALWDRENRETCTGADVKMKESYCWLTGLGDSTYVIEDAMCDQRLQGHAAQVSVRSYVAVLLRDRSGAAWGTLCHFDFDPRVAAPDSLTTLDFFRPLIEEMVVRDSCAQWDPDAPSLRRVARSET